MQMVSSLTGSKRLRTALVSLLILIGQPSLFAAGLEIPKPNNLAEIGQLSRQQGVPVIVFVTREACPYCRKLRDTILNPMFAADKFEQKAILVEVSLDRVDPLTGFKKNQIAAKAFAELYKAGITPTLLFLDSEGDEIGKRLVGISNLEFYGYYLQRSIDEALMVIRSATPRG